MSVQDLKKYGHLSATFRGKGMLQLSDGRELRARFILAQRPDAQLLFSADIALHSREFLLPSLEVSGLVGELADGRQIRAEGFYLRETMGAMKRSSRLLGYLDLFTIGDEALVDESRISFDIVNFRFEGTEIEQRTVDGLTRSSRSLLSLDLAGRKVELRRSQNYAQVEVSLRAQRGVEVTCTAMTEVSDKEDVEQVTDLIDRLCDLMSIARGTLVSWTAFRISGCESDKHSYACYRNSVTQRFAGIEVIPSEDAESTKLFLERGFERYVDLDADYAIRKIARAYCETRDGPFLQTRGLAIGVLAEYLAGVRARISKRIYFLNEEEFGADYAEFRAAAEAALKETYPQVPKKRVSAMSASFKSVNRRPLDWKLKDLARWVDLKYEAKEIGHLIEIRNSLAHEGDFPNPEDAVVDYCRIQHFLDRLVLRLFDYRGVYNNFELKRRSSI